MSATDFVVFIFIFICCEIVMASYKQNYDNQGNCDPNYYKNNCPSVPTARNFDLDQMLGHWYIIETTLDLPDCAFAVRTRLPKSYYSYSKPSSYGNSGNSYGNSGGNSYGNSGGNSYGNSGGNSYGNSGGNAYYKPKASYDPPTQEEQMLTVNYFDRYSNRAKTRYTGNTTRLSYNGGSYTNFFTSGSVSDVKILYVDYDYICGYVLMITCTTQANGYFEVNSNILSRTPWLDPYHLKSLHGILLRNGLGNVESRLKANSHRNCQPQASYAQKNEY